MITVLTTVAAIFLVATACFIVLRDLYNIAEALTSGIKLDSRKPAANRDKIQIKNAYASR